MAYPVPICWFEPIILTKHGQRRNKIYFASTVPFTDFETLQTAADALSADLAPKIVDLLSEEARYVGGNLRYIDATHDLEVFTEEGADDGDIAGQMLPDETCLVIQKRTGQAGRDKRGRYFFSGIPEDGQDDGIIESGSVLADAAAALASYLGADIVLGSTTLHARHYDRKTNTLLVVTQCRPLAVLGSRRDRRAPLQISNSFF